MENEYHNPGSSYQHRNKEWLYDNLTKVQNASFFACVKA